MQYFPQNPGSQDKHVPFFMSHILSLHVSGHTNSHLFPYNPDILQPTKQKVTSGLTL